MCRICFSHLKVEFFSLPQYLRSKIILVQFSFQVLFNVLLVRSVCLLKKQQMQTCSQLYHFALLMLARVSAAFVLLFFLVFSPRQLLRLKMHGCCGVPTMLKNSLARASHQELQSPIPNNFACFHEVFSLNSGAKNSLRFNSTVGCVQMQEVPISREVQRQTFCQRLEIFLIGPNSWTSDQVAKKNL